MTGKKIISAVFLSVFVSIISSPAYSARIPIRFSWWGPESRQKATLDAIKIYQKRNPSVKIVGEYMDFNGYMERMVVQFSGGNEPDLMQVNWAWIETTLSKDGTNLYDLFQVKNLIRLDEFEGREKDGVINGHLNGLPVSYTSKVIIWQKRTFQKAGIPYPKTWDDLFKTAKIFSAKLGPDYYPLIGSFFDRMLLTHVWATQKFGKPYVDISTGKIAYSKDQMKEFILFMKKLRTGHVMSPCPDITPADQSASPQWITGKWAGAYKWETEASLFTKPLKDAVVDLGDLPVIPGAKDTGAFARPAFMYVVSKRSKHPEEAAKFLNFLLTDPEALRAQGATRGIPAAKSALQQFQKEKTLSAIQIKVMNNLKKNPPPRRSAWFEHIRLQDFSYRVLSDCDDGKISDDEAARRLVDEANMILRSIR